MKGTCIICEKETSHTHTNPNELVYKYKIFHPSDKDIFCDYCFKLMMVEYNEYDEYLGEKEKEKDDLITFENLESYWKEIKIRTKNKYPIEKKKDLMKIFLMVFGFSVFICCLVLIL